MKRHEPYVVASRDLSVVTVVFSNAIEESFLSSVRKIYRINDTYRAFGLDSPIRNNDGHIVIYAKL